MPKRCCRARFTEEAWNKTRVLVKKILADHFERPGLLQHDVSRPVDDPHPATPQAFVNAIRSESPAHQHVTHGYLTSSGFGQILHWTSGYGHWQASTWCRMPHNSTPCQ